MKVEPGLLDITMKYPNFLKKGNTIGLACPSFGCNADPYLSRYLSAKKKLSELGYNLIEAPSVYRLENAESNTCDVRAKELLDLYCELKDLEDIYNIKLI